MAQQQQKGSISLHDAPQGAQATHPMEQSTGNDSFTASPSAPSSNRHSAAVESTSSSSGRPQADPNAFMTSNDQAGRRASWQSEMSPAERAKALEQEMKEKAKGRKQQRGSGKLMKVGGVERVLQ
jgi:hypothetical protein